MKPLLLILPGLAVAAGLSYAALSRQAAVPAGVEISTLSSNRSLVWREPQTSAGLCPWREQEKDRRRFFPTSVSSRDETLVLSRQRPELQRRLGRMPGADDNALIVHRILGPSGSPGVVVTRRVRGECGLIELVLAADPNGRVLGARIQRQREPEATARALQSPAWLDAFRGKDSRAAWKLGEDVPDVPAEARPSAEAVVAEARTVLILLDVALHSNTSLPPDPHGPHALSPRKRNARRVGACPPPMLGNRRNRAILRDPSPARDRRGTSSHPTGITFAWAYQETTDAAAGHS